MPMTSNTNYGILVDYYYCTGCHACEVACKVELGLPTGQYGIKILTDGPRKNIKDKWEFNNIPLPTELCNLCEDRTAMGKLPTCVHHCPAGVMYYGTIDELAAQMQNMPTDKPAVLFSR